MSSSAYGGRTYSVPMYVGILDAPPAGGGNGTGTGLTGQYFDNPDLTNNGRRLWVNGQLLIDLVDRQPGRHLFGHHRAAGRAEVQHQG